MESVCKSFSKLLICATSEGTYGFVTARIIFPLEDFFFFNQGWNSGHPQCVWCVWVLSSAHTHTHTPAPKQRVRKVLSCIIPPLSSSSSAHYDSRSLQCQFPWTPRSCSRRCCFCTPELPFTLSGVGGSGLGVEEKGTKVTYQRGLEGVRAAARREDELLWYALTQI